MALKRLGAILIVYIVALNLAISLALPPELCSAITPHREIVPVDTPDVPLWKSYWDAGREYVRQGNYTVAAEYYKELYLRKPQIEEAKWEYCKVLFKLEDFDIASPLLESLLEQNPYQEEYLAMAGYVALETREYGRAVTYLGQVYALHPEGKEGIKALSGLILGLQKTGKKRYAFNLMEQLRLRRPDTLPLVLELGRSAAELGLFEKADDYYSILIDTDNVDNSVLEEAAEMYLSFGKGSQATRLWDQLLARDPDNISYHRKFIDYYRKSGKSSDALPHILAVLEIDKNYEAELLLEVGRIQADAKGRADKAIRYYERYLQQVPQDQKALEELQTAREAIADELLAIVENDGAELLWQDLKEFTENRLSIYQLMAEKLESSANKVPLIDVLKVIYENSTDKEAIALRLSEIYASVENYGAAYAYIQKIHSEKNLTYSHYVNKAHLEERLGRSRDALDSMFFALKKRPESLELTKKAIVLAGDLGLVKDLKSLAAPLISSALADKKFSVYLSYLHGLRINGQYVEAEALYARMLNREWPKQKQRTLLLLHRADTLRMMGLEFESQRILRKMVVDGQGQQKALSRLIAYSIDSGAIEDGWALYRYYEKGRNQIPQKELYSDDNIELFREYIHLLEAEGDITTAIEELKKYSEKIPAGQILPNPGDALTPLQQELFRLHYRAGNVDTCRAILKEYESKKYSSRDIRLFTSILAGKGKMRVGRFSKETLSARNQSGGVLPLFLAAERAEVFGDFSAALELTDKILEVFAQSLRATVSKARLLKQLGRVDESTELYKELWQRNNDELPFYREYLGLEFRRGNYPIILSELTEDRLKTLPIEFNLLKARTLWASNNQSQALKLYKELVKPGVSEQFKRRLAEKNLRFQWQEEDKQAFWHLFTYEQPDQLEILNSLRGEKGFLAMAQTPVGEISADLYASYRWEKLIKNEYHVRKAVDDNEYIIAEKKFRKNLQNDRSTEGLKDLARIYERLGDTTKEAEVYSYLAEKGEKVPELQESIERNKLARAPTISIEYSTVEKDGRDGLVDLVKTSAGTGFKYNPSLSTEVSLQFGELNYSDVSGDNTLSGREFSGRGSYDFNDKSSASVGLGLHMMDSEVASTHLYDLRFDHGFDEILSGYMQYKQSVIDDTLEALEQALHTGSITAGMLIEGTTGINIGGEYRRLWYDEDNDQDRLFLWSSYSFFSKYNTFQLKYSYELLNNSQNNYYTVETIADPVIDAETGEILTDVGETITTTVDAELPYWSPGGYWQHQLTFSVRHLLSQFEGFEKAPSYYALDFSVGYESEENFTYSGKFDIFLEMNTHFLLKGELLYSNSDDYSEQRAAASLMYRW
jgi:lipopolysaccharide biosynthesis regulator YciM